MTIEKNIPTNLAHMDPMDENQIALFATLPEQEWRIATLRLIGQIEERVDAQTEIAAETQELLNRDVIGKVSEMYDAFDTARNGFRMFAAVGNGVMKTADAVYKHGRPLLFLAAIGATVITAVKTGNWVWPWWWPK